MDKESALKEFDLSRFTKHEGVKSLNHATLRFIEELYKEGYIICSPEEVKKIDEKYLQDKTIEMIDIISKGKILEAMRFLRRVISDVQNRQPEIDKAFIKKWKKEFHNAIDAIKLYEEMSFGERVDIGFDMVGDERDVQLSRLIPGILKEAGVKIK